MACQRSTPVSDGPGAQVAPAGPSTSTWCFSGRARPECRHFRTSLPSATHRSFSPTPPPFFFTLLFSHKLNFFSFESRPTFHSVEHIQRQGGDMGQDKVTTLVLRLSTHIVPVFSFFFFLRGWGWGGVSLAFDPIWTYDSM